MSPDAFLTRLRRHAGTAPEVTDPVTLPADDRPAAPAAWREDAAIEAHVRRRITGDPARDPAQWLRERTGGRGAVVALPPGTVRAGGPEALERTRAAAAPGDVLLVREQIGTGARGWTAQEADTVTRLVGGAPGALDPAERADDLLADWERTLEPVGGGVLGGAVLAALAAGAAAGPQRTRLLLVADGLLVDSGALPPAVVWGAYRVPA